MCKNILNNTMQENLILIAAISKNNVIGKDNKLPWHLPKDLEHFKHTTLNSNVVMGKNTFNSIFEYLGKPLPKRNNIVLSTTLQNDAIEIYSSLQDLYNKYKNQKLYVIGGETLYNQTINDASELIISHVDIECAGDAFFPIINDKIWQIKDSINIDDKIPFTLTKYIRQL